MTTNNTGDVNPLPPSTGSGEGYDFGPDAESLLWWLEKHVDPEGIWKSNEDGPARWSLDGGMSWHDSLRDAICSVYQDPHTRFSVSCMTSLNRPVK